MDNKMAYGSVDHAGMTPSEGIFTCSAMPCRRDPLPFRRCWPCRRKVRVRGALDVDDFLDLAMIFPCAAVALLLVIRLVCDGRALGLLVLAVLCAKLSGAAGVSCAGDWSLVRASLETWTRFLVARVSGALLFSSDSSSVSASL